MKSDRMRKIWLRDPLSRHLNLRLLVVQGSFHLLVKPYDIAQPWLTTGFRFGCRLRQRPNDWGRVAGQSPFPSMYTSILISGVGREPHPCISGWWLGAEHQ